jgi:hypothetical protein
MTINQVSEFHSIECQIARAQRYRLTLYSYINTYSSENINNFKKVFQNDINKLPNKMISSKSMMRTLNIDNKDDYYKQLVFTKVYMEYFKNYLHA